MRSYKNHKTWFMAFLLLITAGCSDPDKSPRTVPGVTPPAVISVGPQRALTGSVPTPSSWPPSTRQ